MIGIGAGCAALLFPDPIEQNTLPWFEDPIALAMSLPPLALPAFVFVSAMLEYIFPPYLGDMFVLFGFFLAGQGASSPWLLFVLAVLGSSLGAGIAYQLGSKYGMAVIRRILARRRRLVRQETLDDIFSRFDERILTANRFLPFLRGFMLYAAGAFRFRFWPAVFFAALSNLAFMGLMLWVGLVTSGSWEQIRAAARQYNLMTAGVVITALVVWMVIGLRRAQATPQS